MNKTLSSLALLKVNWDDPQRKDFLDIFVPFIAALIKRKNYDLINPANICGDFESEYGLAIPYHPMLTILTRTAKRGYIKRTTQGRFSPVKEKLSDVDFSSISTEQERKYKKVIDKFITFCQEKHHETFSEIQAENVLISFLKDHDLDILFITQDYNSILPEASSSTIQKYLINSFIKNIQNSEPDIFNFIVDISVGHIIANTMLYCNVDSIRGRLAGCNFYLDIGFLFNIMGINGDDKKRVYIDFIKLIASHKANIFIFQHTYDEFRGILEGCLYWIENPHFDPLKASKAANYFIENQILASDIEQLILDIEAKLVELKIRVMEAPNPSQENQYQIDEARLIETIVDIYRKNDPDFDEQGKESTVYKDVKSISAIYKLRGGQKPTILQDAQHIFVTTNSSLAHASKLFESQSVERGFFFIPSALTDVFVGTIIWIQSPKKVTEANEKRIIANCYAALQPSRKMINRLIETAESLRSTGTITDDDVILLKQSRVARNILQEETLGDINRVSDKTVTEILDEVRLKIRKEEQEKFALDRAASQAQEKRLSDEIERERQTVLNTKKSHEATLEELNKVQIEKENIKKHIETLASHIALGITITFYVISFAVVVTVIIAQFYPDMFKNSHILYTILIIIAVIFTLITILTGFNIRGAGNKLKNLLKQKIISILLKSNH